MGAVGLRGRISFKMRWLRKDPFNPVAPVTTRYFPPIDAGVFPEQSQSMHSRRARRDFGYRCVAALLVAGLCNVPGAMATTDRPLGTVTDAARAHLDGASAVSGATLYAGDAVETDSQGALRLRLGAGQLYLSASSSMSLEERAGMASVTLARGSASFSLPDPSQFELETPAGILRGSGTKATRGQVSITNAHEIVVTATNGDLVLDNDGELYTIPEGKAYRVVIDGDSASANNDSPQNTQHRKRRLLFFLIGGGALLATSAILWHHVSESQYTPN